MAWYETLALILVCIQCSIMVFIVGVYVGSKL